MREKINLYGLECKTDNYAKIANTVMDTINGSTKKAFIHVNLHNLTLLLRDEGRLKFLSGIANFYFEGIGLKLLTFACGKGWQRDTNGTDLYPVLAKLLNNEGKSIYIIGATQPVAENAITNIKAAFPNIKIAGFHHGYFPIQDSASIVEDANQSNPDLIMLGMGMEKEASFIENCFHSLNTRCVWCTGGLLDFISGAKPRAPKTIRALRLEWLFRLMLEPRTKFHRVFVAPFKLILKGPAPDNNPINNYKENH